MLLAMLIGSDRRRHRGTRSGRRENWFALGANRDKAVHVFCIRHDRIYRRCRKIILLGGELSEEAVIAWMNGTQEELHPPEEIGPYDGQTTRSVGAPTIRRKEHRRI